MLNNMSIRAKVLGAFALVLAILSGVSAFSVYELSEVNHASTEITQNWLPSIELIGAVNTAASDLRTAKNAHILQTTDEGMRRAEQIMEEERTTIKDELAQYEKLISSEEERALYRAFTQAWAESEALDAKVIELSRANRNEEARDLLIGESRTVYNKADALLTQLVDLNEAGALAASARGDEIYAFSRNMIALAVALAVVGTILVAWALVRSVSVPVTRMTDAMTRLGQGDKTIQVEGAERGDEIGGMARALQVFKDTAIEAERLAAEEAKALELRTRRAKALEELTKSFNEEASAVVRVVSSAATEMQATASSMSETAERGSIKATAVAAASEQAAANVQTVASAAEELTSSVQEITRQVSESTRIAGDAVELAMRSGQLVRTLADAAQRVGTVVGLIDEIAEKTNLLALNATIEAARAGEMGKGFAVVASEVKTLANQTSKATGEIATQISGMQQSTNETVTSIERISSVIGRINEITTAIAAAVEEQGAATSEISRNAQEAANGTQEVSSNITGVTEAAQHTGSAASQMYSASSELAQQADTLRRQVEHFIDGVKAI